MRARDYFEKYDTLIMEEQKNGVSPLNYDAFRCYWMTAMPELAGKL